MIGLIIAIVIVLLIIVYVLKSIFEQTDYQTWLNIALVTVILLTIILSIYMILNKVSSDSKKQNTPAVRQEQPIEEQETNKELLKGEEKPVEKAKPASTEDMTDEELSIAIAEDFLKLKKSYEDLNDGQDGSIYAANKIIQDYDLNKSEWDDFYRKAITNGYFEQAEKNLKEKEAAAKKATAKGPTAKK